MESICLNIRCIEINAEFILSLLCFRLPQTNQGRKGWTEEGPHGPEEGYRVPVVGQETRGREEEGLENEDGKPTRSLGGVGTIVLNLPSTLWMWSLLFCQTFQFLDSVAKLNCYIKRRICSYTCTRTKFVLKSHSLRCEI